MKTKHNILSLFLIGILYCLSISIVQPAAVAKFDSTALTHLTNIQTKKQLANPLFFESDTAEINVLLEGLEFSTEPTINCPFSAITSSYQYHTTTAANYLTLSKQLVLKTRKVDLLYPSHYFW